MKIRDILMNPGSHCPGSSIGLLLLRILPSSLLLTQVWSKLSGLNEAIGDHPVFFDLSGPPGLVSAILFETLCPLLLILGLGTRLAALPLVGFMSVTAMIVHSGQPLTIREPELLFVSAFLPLLFTGAGEYSLDAHLTLCRGYDNTTSASATGT
jgi:putative oxidoreductase